MRGEASSASHTALRLATKASRKELHVLTAAQRSAGEGSFFSTSAHSSGDSALASVAAGCEEDTAVAATAAVLLAVGGAMLAGDAIICERLGRSILAARRALRDGGRARRAGVVFKGAKQRTMALTCYLGSGDQVNNL